ncbi:MAG: hypothetical protein ACYTGN_18705 [Planctomycetota bacterium]|jgi:hypothetical protein
MRMRERGIGNLPFIAVLVLFVIATVLFFLKQDEADKALERTKAANVNLAKAQGDLVKMVDAYKSIRDVIGVADAALDASTTNIPNKDKVAEVIRNYVNAVVKQATQDGEVTLDTKVYSIEDQSIIKEQAGDKTVVRFYQVSTSPDNTTVKTALDPISKALAAAAKIAAENNSKHDQSVKDRDRLVEELKGANATAQSAYQSDLAAKQQAAEGWKTQLDSTRSNLETLTTKLDQKEAEFSTKIQAKDKELRTISRGRDAWKSRAINEKDRKALAIKEDPIDGQVIAVSDVLGTLWINLGRRNKLSSGTRFIVWRPAKGNVRENIAECRVINVTETRSECRITKRLSSRVRPTEGMNISNPFYDPKGKLTAYIFGDLKTYPSDQAARRLAAAGVKVSRTLDLNVNIIILGEPPKGGDEEIDMEDAAAVSQAETKAKMDRGKRLDWIMSKAVAIGAIVVTEDRLATFIEW